MKIIVINEFNRKKQFIVLYAICELIVQLVIATVYRVVNERWKKNSFLFFGCQAYYMQPGR